MKLAYTPSHFKNHQALVEDKSISNYVNNSIYN